MAIAIKITRNQWFIGDGQNFFMEPFAAWVNAALIASTVSDFFVMIVKSMSDTFATGTRIATACTQPINQELLSHNAHSPRGGRNNI